MKAFRIIMRVISITLLASAMICGLYLRGQGTPVDPGSLQFHMTIGIAAVIFTVVTLFLPGKKTKQ
ncbi:hypothetical protein SAMN02745823_03389 [Sporobacter termitidis DSM 10068]|uniref:Uncharacterized protein n=1 Tax=Sporobacter termitidis DSM 10068 TaxID=1123282 RepID=A0A1M5Z8U5_9FIRM|nr:hypothetical protein [Sporobacter termitidis]SHI20655.1 hypothetical protein SAMN02745823_03389 [Sporobacter termitidis DSM 10068]